MEMEKKVITHDVYIVYYIYIEKKVSSFLNYLMLLLRCLHLSH